MMSQKRALTDKTRSENLAIEAVRTDSVSSELAARLRGVGSRVRKNVTEGYNTNRYTSAPTSSYTSPLKPKGPSSTTFPIFQSANETLHEVLSSGLSSDASSSRKRGRAESDPDPPSQSETADGDADTEMAGNDQMFGRNADIGEFGSAGGRIFKPLPALSRRRLLETRSLPVGSLYFGGQTDSSPAKVGNVVMDGEDEEDWSAFDGFGSSGGSGNIFKPMEM